MSTAGCYPASVAMLTNVQDLENLLALPTPADLDFMASRLKGDLIILGAGGKMGPTLVARAAAANCGRHKIYAVSRHGDFAPGVTVIRADLSDRKQVDALPDAPNVLFLVGRKFGSTGNEYLTWSTNTIVPALCAERYADTSRIVALSTGNVYPFLPADSGGATEDTPPAPIGEYAWSALGRERVFESYARQRGTAVTIIRLNYAVEPRYGTLVDIAEKVLTRRPVDLTTGYLNCIWQGDANSVCLRAFDLCAAPAPAILNLTGTATLKVRDIAGAFGRRFGCEPILTGDEDPTALLNNAAKCARIFGEPPTALETMLDRIADWLAQGGPTLGKPTHFEVRSGQF